jgi:hypothetical protein
MLHTSCYLKVSSSGRLCRQSLSIRLSLWFPWNELPITFVLFINSLLSFFNLFFKSPSQNKERGTNDKIWHYKSKLNNCTMGMPKEIIRTRQMEWEEIYPLLISKKMSPLTCNTVEWNRV